MNFSLCVLPFDCFNKRPTALYISKHAQLLNLFYGFSSPFYFIMHLFTFRYSSHDSSSISACSIEKYTDFYISTANYLITYHLPSYFYADYDVELIGGVPNEEVSKKRH